MSGERRDKDVRAGPLAKQECEATRGNAGEGPLEENHLLAALSLLTYGVAGYRIG